MTNLIGQEVGGYQIEEQIGQGGMATVYKAYEAATDRYVALKILPQQYSDDPKFMERFKREARALAKLEHIHILPIHAYGEQDGITYLAMRYVPTGSLKDRIRQYGAFPLHEASRLLSQIAGALDHAHRHGILHRDVKPANVLLDADENAYLTDFGIARLVGATADLTGGGVIGTPAYMPPEQLEESAQVTPASDQYALGIVLYEMVTGRTPYQAETPVAMITKKLTTPLPPPSAFCPDLPESAELVILKALAKDPAARFASCGELADQFAAALEGLPVDVQRPAASPDDLTYDSSAEAAAFAPTAAAPAPTAVARRGMPAWLIGLLAVLGIGVVGAAIFFGLVSGNRSESDPDTLATQAAGAVQEAAAAIMDSTQTAAAAQAAGSDDSAATIAPEAVEPTAPQPTPTTAVGLNFSEDFGNSEYDGSFSMEQWTFFGESLDQVNQQEGSLIITQEDQPDGSAGLTAIPLTAFKIDEAMYFEADLNLGINRTSGIQTSGIVYLELGTGLPDGRYWTSQCNIGSGATLAAPYSTCRDWAWTGAAEENSYYKTIPISLESWHSYRIEVDPVDMTFSYYIDDELVGTHTPVDAEDLKGARFTFRVGVWTKTDVPITGYVDNVRVGYLADEAAAQPTPTAYDDFDNPVFDGSFNTDIWVHDDDLSAEVLAAHQEDGRLVFDNVPFPESTDRSIRFPDIWTQEDLDFVESRLQIGDDVTGGFSLVKLQLSGNTWEWWAQIKLTGAPDEPDPSFICDITINDTLDELKGIPIAYNVWYTARIAVDWDTESLNYYLDDQLKCIYPLPAGTLYDATFRVEIGVWQEPNASVTAYIDDVLVGLLEP